MQATEDSPGATNAAFVLQVQPSRDLEQLSSSLGQASLFWLWFLIVHRLARDKKVDRGFMLVPQWEAGQPTQGSVVAEFGRGSVLQLVR